MRSILGGVVCLCLAAPAEAADWGVRLRRITWAAACAASAWDAATTHSAVRLGARETNPLLADRNGKPRWGRIIGIKVGVCAGSALVQELSGRNEKLPVVVWTGLNLSLTGVYTRVAVHNRSVAADLAAKRAAIPQYLLPPQPDR